MKSAAALALVCLLSVACGPHRYTNVPVNAEPGLETATTQAVADWNAACGTPVLFRNGTGDIRILFVDELPDGQWARNGAAILVSRERWFGTNKTGAPTNDDDRLAVVTHELWHRLTSGWPGEDGLGHFLENGHVGSRLDGASKPTARDIQQLRALGYACKGGLQ